MSLPLSVSSLTKSALSFVVIHASVTASPVVAATTGEVITDAWITTKIKADFVNEDTLKGSDINVDTNNHVVTLKGTVTSAAGKSRAAAIAKTTKGVHSVVNLLTIAPKS